MKFPCKCGDKYLQYSHCYIHVEALHVLLCDMWMADTGVKGVRGRNIVLHNAVYYLTNGHGSVDAGISVWTCNERQSQVNVYPDV